MADMAAAAAVLLVVREGLLDLVLCGLHVSTWSSGEGGGDGEGDLEGKGPGLEGAAFQARSRLARGLHGGRDFQEGFRQAWTPVGLRRTYDQMN